MKYRKLRIAWSVGWGLVAVLLCVLWVRSYSTLDRVSRITAVSTFQVRSYITLETVSRISAGTFQEIGVTSATIYYKKITNVQVVGAPDPTQPWRYKSTTHYWSNVSTFSRRVSPDGLVFRMPIWAPAVTLAFVASMPWLSPRFSLRTLLIATTLVALLLGVLVWTKN